MELLEPHIILRKGLVAGTCYPRLVDHITTFLARTLFLSSDLAVPAAQKKQGIAAFAGNHALCKITEDLIFTEPYFQAEQNRWTSPWLDATAADFREDLDLHVAISRLKLKFMTSPEALIHGDLHTGSIMVTRKRDAGDRSRVRLLRPDGIRSRRRDRQSHHELSRLGRPRTHAGRTPRRSRPGCWKRSKASGTGLRVKFVALWRDQRPMATPIRRRCSPVPVRRGAARGRTAAYMERLFQDTVGFSAAKIIRRILGLAHNIDFELIEDPRARAVCEARSLRLARAMMLDTAVIPHHRRRDRGRAAIARTGSPISPWMTAAGSTVYSTALARNRCA